MLSFLPSVTVDLSLSLPCPFRQMDREGFQKTYQGVHPKGSEFLWHKEKQLAVVRFGLDTSPIWGSAAVRNSALEENQIYPEAGSWPNFCTQISHKNFASLTYSICLSNVKFISKREKVQAYPDVTH